MLESIITGVKVALKESVNETIGWFMAGLVANILSVSHAVTLIGCGVLIILYIGGYTSGLQKAGILIVSNIMIKYLLG